MSQTISITNQSLMKLVIPFLPSIFKHFNNKRNDRGWIWSIRDKAYYYNHILIVFDWLFILWRRFNDCAFQNINSEWLLCKFVLAHIPDLISKSTTSAKLLEKKMAQYLSNTFTSEGWSFKAEWSKTRWIKSILPFR